MSSGDIDMLMDMGFSQSKAEKALEITGNKGVEPAMEWLLAHSDEAEPSPEASTAESAPTPSAETPSQDSVANTAGEESADSAKSIKCDVCGKLFKTHLEVEFHATKLGHDKFSESTEEKKPLTEDEKKEQLKLLQEKIKQKKQEREEQEKKDALEREKNRIRSGKEMAEARRRFEELEMKKMFMERKREKDEERLAKQRVREQIEADKAARRARAEAERSAPTSTPAATTTPSTQKKKYTETRLQIRLTNGQTLTQTFGSKEQLSAVRLFVEMNRTDGSGPFNLMTNFPRKIFSEDDYDTPLYVLGLIPSAVVIVQKKSCDSSRK